ncbi:hypothetical protein KCU81_g1788, partial [Aureobasidium melanogenum]
MSSSTLTVQLEQEEYRTLNAILQMLESDLYVFHEGERLASRLDRSESETRKSFYRLIDVSSTAWTSEVVIPDGSVGSGAETTSAAEDRNPPSQPCTSRQQLHSWLPQWSDVAYAQTSPQYSPVLNRAQSEISVEGDRTQMSTGPRKRQRVESE